TGISIESSFQFGWTPLMCAASVADFVVVRLLLDRGANACFEAGDYTVLMAACTARASEESILKTAELLLSRNADPNATCRKQMTPLMYAARKGCPLVVDLLVAHGSHVNTQDENGYTALMWAAKHGHKSVILKLLELGADKNLQTKDEKTAAELAKINQYSEIYSLLSLAGNHVQERYHEKFKQEDISKYVTAALDDKVSVNSAFDDMEVFLRGLGLEHIKGILKEKDITLRKLLVMEKVELIQIGITNPQDQKKLLDTVSELQVEEIRLEDLLEVKKVELSRDEFVKCLQKLNKECSKLITPVQTMNKHFLQKSCQIPLQWAGTESLIEVCKGLVCSVEQLGEEVTKLKCLV
ncbi:ASZ1 protein, partial [Heliornis fulica]|nr:ASZ1 protein [Heliornis fulica]